MDSNHRPTREETITLSIRSEHYLDLEGASDLRERGLVGSFNRR